jgi:hypothetical protein
MNSCAAQVNANRASRFPGAQHNFTGAQNRDKLPLVPSDSLSPQEIVMASSSIRYRISRFAFAAISAVAGLLWANAAFASQGPGVSPGTASNFTQMMMAIIVYGTSALVVGAGLIGATRRRPH